MSANVIKEFLVGLGYKVDESGQRRFVDGVNNATDVVNKLGTALKVLATGAAVYGVVHWFDKITGSMEDVYYAAKRTGSSVRELQSFTYAASQMGSSAAQALSNAQSIYQFFRNQPNAPDWLRSHLGVNALDANGKLKSGVQLAEEIGAALNKQPRYLQAQYAEQTGMPLELRMALQQAAQFKHFQAEYEAMLRKAGLNPDQAAEQARNFQRSARGIGAAFDIVKNAVMGALTGHKGATGALSRFRDMILSRVPQITRILSKLADAGVTAFGKFLDWLDTVDWDKVFTRIEEFFDWLLSLDPKQMIGYLKTIAAVLGVIFGLQMLANIATFAGGMTRLLPLFSGVANGLTLVAGAVGATTASLLGLIAAALYSKGLGGARRPDGTYEDEAQSAAAMAAAAKDPRTAAWLRQQQAMKPGQAIPLPSGKNVPRGIRNNNPGNIKYGDFAIRMGATGKDADGFAIFPDARTGLNAIAANLASYARKGINTPSEIAHRWSTTDQDSYTAMLAKALGVDPNQAVNMADPKVINALRNGIIMQENGRNPYAAESATRAPVAAAAGPNQSLKADTTIHVHGSSNPVATAREVAGAQDGVNQRLVRNFRQIYA